MVILVVIMVMALTLVSFHGHDSVVVMMAWTWPGLKGAMVIQDHALWPCGPSGPSLV